MLYEVITVEQTQIFPHLKCSKEAAVVLQRLTRKYIGGQEDMLVVELLQDIFGIENYEYVNHLPSVRLLLELGWITQHAFTTPKVSEITLLELLGSAVALTHSRNNFV